MTKRIVLLFSLLEAVGFAQTLTVNINGTPNQTISGVGYQAYFLPSGGDDTPQFLAAITAGYPIQLGAGSYSITCATAKPNFYMLSSPISIRGAGQALTKLVNHCANQDVFDVTWSFNGATPVVAGELSDFQIVPASGVTPTAGHSISVFGSGSNIVAGLLVRRVAFMNTWDGIYTGSNVWANWFEDYYCLAVVSNSCITVSSPTTAGDSFFKGGMIIGNGSNQGGVLVQQSDTFTFDDTKINSANFEVAPTTGQTVAHLILNNLRIEQGAFNASNSGGGTMTDLGITGGHMESPMTLTGVIGASIVGMQFATGSYISQSGGNSTITGNLFDTSGNSGVLINLTGGAQTVIGGNAGNAHGTYYVQTDSSITSGLLRMTPDGVPLASNFNAATLVPGNILPVAIPAVSNSQAYCPAGTVFIDASNNINGCNGNTIYRVAASAFSVGNSFVSSFAGGASFTAGAKTATFTATPALAGDAITFHVGCASATANPTAVAITASGWTITELGSVSNYTGTSFSTGQFGAISTSTQPATFTITWTSTGTCGGFIAWIANEYTGNALTFATAFGFA